MAMGWNGIQFNRKKIKMQQKDDQVFSLKSNLITQFKGVSLNLNNYKNNQHQRLKSVCFSNVLKTIRNDVARFRNQDKEKLQLKDKQNNGMIIEACNFMAVYGNEGPTVGQPPRTSIMHSRSFLIRSFNNKKTDKPVSSDKKVPMQAKTVLHHPSSVFKIKLQQFNLTSASKVKTKITLKQPKHPTPVQPSLTLIICPEVLQKGVICFSVLRHLVDKNINVCIIVNRDKQDKEYQQFCYRLVVKQEVEYRGIGNKEVIMDFTEEIIEKLGENILVLTADQKFLYIPYYESKALYFYQQEWNLRLAFLKIGHQALIRGINVNDDFVDIEAAPQGHITTNDQVNKKWKLYRHEKVYPLSREVRLQLETLNRLKIDQKSGSFSYAPAPQLQQIQQKLLEYSKILKRQQEQNPKPNPEPKNNPGKQARRSLASKTPYQIIYQLVKNNNSTHRQINTFISESRDVSLAPPEDFECDDLICHCIQ